MELPRGLHQRLPVLEVLIERVLGQFLVDVFELVVEAEHKFAVVCVICHLVPHCR